MSYKFQRLRERLRGAIDAGELSGKLPGERALAKRFHVNAKTLSKALTDLAAEGVLDRSIGRGTYVKGTAPALAGAAGAGRWLVLCDPTDANAETSPLVQAVRDANPVGTHVAAGVDPQQMRPSFLNQFDAVIDLSRATPEPFLRDLVVRSVPLVAVGHEPRTYSMHCVVVDAALAASRLGRDLLLGGHRRIAAVEPRGTTTISQSLRQAAARCAPDAMIDGCTPDEVPTMLAHGVTALVCDSPQTAEAVRREADRHGINVPGQVSLAAVGCANGSEPCSGYFVTGERMIEAAVGLLRDAAAATRPAALWLAGEYIDRGTIALADGGAPAPVLEKVHAHHPHVRSSGVLV